MNIHVKETTKLKVNLLVEKEPWKEVTSLADSSQQDHVFVLDQKSGQLRFGNGENGRRLPVGSNIKAGFRFGGGSEGNIDDGVFMILGWKKGSLSKNYYIDAVTVKPFIDRIEFKVRGKSDDGIVWESIGTLCEKSVALDELENECVKLSFSDLVLSLTPWPFRKDLPENYCGKKPNNNLWDLLLLVLNKSNYRNRPNQVSNEAPGNSESKKKHTHLRQGRPIVNEINNPPLLTHEIYGDPEIYLEVAIANRLTNFRKLKTGGTLIFPPLEKNDD